MSDYGRDYEIFKLIEGEMVDVTPKAPCAPPPKELL